MSATEEMHRDRLLLADALVEEVVVEAGAVSDIEVREKPLCVI